jgi:hypothetical protein
MAKAAAKSKEHKPSTSRAIAGALVKHWPKDAEQIVKVMLAVATSNPSWHRKLERVQRALERLRKDGQ